MIAKMCILSNSTKFSAGWP